MSLLLGSEFIARLPDPEPSPEDRYAALAASIRDALERVQQAIGALPAPQVHVAEPDLTAIVTAVNGLKPSVEPTELAAAIRDALHVPTPEPDPNQSLLSETLSNLAEKLGLLEFRMKGIGVATAPLTLPDNPNRQLGQVSISGTPTVSSDVSDRAARLLGHVTVDNASLTTDVTDRVARLLGHVQVDNFPATQPVSGTVTANIGTGNLAGITGTVTTKQSSSTGTETNVASSATSVTVLASNASRLGATVYNDSTQILYLLLGSGTASNSNYTLQMAAGSYYEVPFGYTGQLTGIWASANGNARVTELT